MADQNASQPPAPTERSLSGSSKLGGSSTTGGTMRDSNSTTACSSGVLNASQRTGSFRHNSTAVCSWQSARER
eukprot:202046-Prymnesium_polylepis.1